MWLYPDAVWRCMQVNSWTLSTYLTDEDAKEWSAVAACHQKEPMVFVVFFVDGGEADWSFDSIKKTAYLLAHGAHFIYSADDAYNPSIGETPHDLDPRAEWGCEVVRVGWYRRAFPWTRVPPARSRVGVALTSY